MADPVLETIAYYDLHAEGFSARTADLDLSHLYDRFLRYIPPGGRILDAGCGVGRDTMAFAAGGYEVVAFDGSKEMVRLARERVGSRAAVHHMQFTEIDWHGKFDGIWACASLLHVPSALFAEVAARLSAALSPGGVLYASFKAGHGERQAGGRVFVDHTKESLRSASEAGRLRLLETWRSNDVRLLRNAQQWWNAIAERVPNRA